jgi:hypothetical protein
MRLAMENLDYLVFGEAALRLIDRVTEHVRCSRWQSLRVSILTAERRRHHARISAWTISANVSLASGHGGRFAS